MGNENMTAAPSGTFRTGDGLLNIAANKQEQFETLCRLLARPELAVDPRFREREERKRRRHELKAEIEASLARDSASRWAALFNANDVPAGEVLDVASVLAHPQVQERGLVRHFAAAPGVGRDIDVVRAGFRLASGDPAPAGPPPELGADTRDVLASLGYGAAEIDRLGAEGAI